MYFTSVPIIFPKRELLFELYLLSFNGSLVVRLPQEELLHLTLRQRHHGRGQQQGRECARGGDRGGDEGRGHDDEDGGGGHVEDGFSATSTPSSHFSLFTDHETNIPSEIERDQIFGEQMFQIQI